MVAALLSTIILQPLRHSLHWSESLASICAVRPFKLMYAELRLGLGVIP